MDVGSDLMEHGMNNILAEPGRATQRDGGMKTLPAGTHHHSGYGLMENATTSEQMVTCIQADM